MVGHDIGLMFAYAYAAQFPNETEKLAVMDAFLPEVKGWEAIYDAADRISGSPKASGSRSTATCGRDRSRGRGTGRNSPLAAGRK